MSQKSTVMFFFTIGSLIGSYLPVFFGVDLFSFTSLLSGAAGGIAGIYIGYKISQNF